MEINFKKVHTGKDLAISTIVLLAGIGLFFVNKGFGITIAVCGLAMFFLYKGGYKKDRLRANYQGTAEAATSTITATAKDGDATIAITCNGTSVTNGQAATLTNNKVNKIVVKVTNGNAEKVYKFDITRGTPT